VIKRVLVANRGEIALRIVRACRELRIETVAVYSDADARAPHVFAADTAVRIGPAASAESYLSIPNLITAAEQTAADAVHPGYGFLSENPQFAEACAAADLIFIGPPAAVIAKLGSKIEARRLMQEAGVPIVPGALPPDQSDDGLAAAAESVGFPVLVKASAGGGGKGMRMVRERADVRDAVQTARREALASFGDGSLYVERLIEEAHHVEVQVFGDLDGRIVHLFERECSVQRRHQKIIEESPSTAVTPGLRARITTAAVRAATAARYRNAGTVEFLVDLGRGHGDAAPFYFLEMNTRLQVEHPVTEEVAGVDLVQAQLSVASGEPLPWTQTPPSQRGHAIEARIYAEDPARGFVPQAGRLLIYREPHLPGVRVDSGVTEGDEISIHYDPLIAKVIAHGETRPRTVSRLIEALRDFPILGVATNIPFVLSVLQHPSFLAGTIDTGYLDREGDRLAAAASTDLPAVVRAVWRSPDFERASMLQAHPSPTGVLDPWSAIRAWS
jgi:acetyl/propionyl-CoA carboxylase alpha subunit